MLRIAKPVSYFLILPFLLLGFSISRAQAAMVDTEAVLNPTLNERDIDRVCV